MLNYLPNHKDFVPTMNEKWDRMLTKKKSTHKKEDFELLMHQKLIVEYLNNTTPHRGILLYHKLGSGKTCTSIAVAESLKSNHTIFVMIPASLEINYYSEIQICGDIQWRKSQHWTFVPMEAIEKEKLATQGLPLAFIVKKKGMWVQTSGKSNSKLTESDREKIEEQLTESIHSQYHQINYNANTLQKNMEKYSKNGTQNPFDNSVVVIDEVHKFVSVIVNHLIKGGTDKETKIYIQMYHWLMTAKSSKFVFLSGTPLVNYPTELSVLFNMLRGIMYTWNFTTEFPTNLAYVKLMLSTQKIPYETLTVDKKSITITKMPAGFRLKIFGTGDYVADPVSITETEMEDQLCAMFFKNKVNVKTWERQEHLCLPDHLKTFLTTFLNIENIETPTFRTEMKSVFQNRILGLTSYFGNIDPSSLPTLIMNKTRPFFLVHSSMSDYQFSQYMLLRKREVNEKQQPVFNALTMFQIHDSYRVYSRACCNFAFPSSPSLEGRPYPLEDEPTEEYKKRIQNAVHYLDSNRETILKSEVLAVYSPKFQNLLKNLKNPLLKGLHLIYTQFRVLEGIEIIRLLLLANGFAEFKLIKTKGDWDIPFYDSEKPHFTLYTGTESSEEKEVLRHIYNSQWLSLPSALQKKLQNIHPNNHMGQIIKIFMITASGAEGINLKNTRYVHLVEPYWHMVRLEQVIGRARRYKSHLELLPMYRNVTAFLYVSIFTPQQKLIVKEQKWNDNSKLNAKTVMTTDEIILEMAEIKSHVSDLFLSTLQETAVDCQVHNTQKILCYKPKPFSNSSLVTYPELHRDIVARGVTSHSSKSKTLKKPKN
jgi:hypothetical protein